MAAVDVQKEQVAGQYPPTDITAHFTMSQRPIQGPTPRGLHLDAILNPNTTPSEPTKDRAANSEIALNWLHTARFLTTAAELFHLPALDVPEIAFVGRSNAGKSTCINTLTQQNQLAYASKKPGRTQHINLFALGRHGQTDAVLADLPGYGYAKVPAAVRAPWERLLGRYMLEREQLKGLALIMDIRHPFTEHDDRLLNWFAPSGKPVHIQDDIFAWNRQ